MVSPLIWLSIGSDQHDVVRNMVSIIIMFGNKKSQGARDYRAVRHSSQSSGIIRMLQ